MMVVKKIFKEHDYCPIRWFAVLDDDSVICIRERFSHCIIYKGYKSIFLIADDDILLEFDTEQPSEDSTLTIALEKINAVLLPGAMDYLGESFDEYISQTKGNY